MSEIIKQLLEPPIAFQPIFAKISDSAAAGLFLSQAYYWSTRKDDGWFYKTQKDWQKETHLTRYEQETARKKLKKIGVLEEKLKGSPAKTHYRVNVEKLIEKIQEFSLLVSSKLECGKPTNRIVGKPQTLNLKETKTTTEITTDISAGNKSGKTDTPKKYDKRTKDERSGHAAIQFIRELLNRYPDKILWNDIIKWFGEDFDRDKLTLCRKTWISRGYNPNATTWMRWYFEGIPEQVSAAQIEAAKDKLSWQSVGKSPMETDPATQSKVNEMLAEDSEISEEEKTKLEQIEFEDSCFAEAVKIFKPNFAEWTKNYKNSIPVWTSVFDEIKTKLNSQIFSSWFASLQYAGAEENIIYIFGSGVAKDWIQSYYGEHFPQAFQKIGKPELKIKWIIENGLEQDEERNTKFYFRRVLIHKYREQQHYENE